MNNEESVKNDDLSKLREENVALRHEIACLRFENDIVRLFSQSNNRGISYVELLRQYGISTYSDLTEYTQRQIGYIPGIGKKFILTISKLMKEKYNLTFQNNMVKPLCGVPFVEMDAVRRRFSVLAGIKVGDKITSGMLKKTELEVEEVIVVLSSFNNPRLIAYKVKDKNNQEKLVSIDDVKTLNGKKYTNNIPY